MTSSQTSPDPWFNELIGTCLASLYLLTLEGCPAADQVGKTAKLWVRLLWDDRRVRWHQEADDARIRAAFASMAATLTRWPAPAKFWEHLKDRPKPKASETLLNPQWGREREAEALACRDRWLADLGLNQWGEPLEVHQ